MIWLILNLIRAGSSSETKPIEQSTSTKQITQTKSTSENLIDLDEGDDGLMSFQPAPEKTTKQEISKPNNGFDFGSKSSQTQKPNAFTLFQGNSQGPNSTQGVQMQKPSADPFQFTDNKPQQQPQPSNTLNNQQTIQPQVDSNSLYNLYKTGNTVDLSLNSQTNNQNYSGGKSNYAYLDMLSNASQQKPYGIQQGFGYQNGSFGQGPTNQFSGPQTGFGGGYVGQNIQSKPSTGFGFGGSNTNFGTGFGGGFSGPSYNTNGGFQQQQPQQGFMPVSNTPSASFGFSAGSTSGGFAQNSSTNTNFFF